MSELTRLLCCAGLLFFSSLFSSFLFSQEVLNDSTSIRGKPWKAIPNNTSVFLVPTGFGMEKGEVYFQNFSLFFNQLHYGASEQLSIGFAFEWLSLLASIDTMRPYRPAFAISPKVSIPVVDDQLHIGLGALFAEIPDTDVFMDLGIVLGTATYGNNNRNISLGIGFGLVEGEFLIQPTVHLSGHYRFSRKLVFIIENMLIPGPDIYLSSLGLRIMGRRLHWDLGLIFSGQAKERNDNIPLIGLVVPFGGK